MSRPIVLIVREPESKKERVETFELNELTVGRGADADLRITHSSLVDVHARFLRRANGELTIIDQEGAHVYVNATRIPHMQAVLHGDVIRIGEAELVVVSETKLDPNEQPLVDAIMATPSDDLLRVVYADWLEEHGFHDRAEYLRLEMQVAEALRGPFKLSIRDSIGILQGLEASLPPAWRALVRRPPKNHFAK